MTKSFFILGMISLLTISISSMDCAILSSRTTQQFNLTRCVIQVTSEVLSINMTYKVINDAKGAIANQINRSTYSAMDLSSRHNFTQKLPGDINHHNGEEITSWQFIALNSTNFPSDGEYFLTTSLCHYYCEGHAYPVCYCDQKYWTKVQFRVQRKQLLNEQQ